MIARKSSCPACGTRLRWMDIETSHIFVCPNCHERLSVTPEYREAIRWLWLVGFAVLLVVGMSTGELNVNAAGWFFASILIMFVATLVLEFIFPPNLARDSTESDVISLDLFPRKRTQNLSSFPIPDEPVADKPNGASGEMSSGPIEYDWHRALPRIFLAALTGPLIILRVHGLGLGVWPLRPCSGGWTEATEFVLQLFAAIALIECAHWFVWYLRQKSQRAGMVASGKDGISSDGTLLAPKDPLLDILVAFGLMFLARPLGAPSPCETTDFSVAHVAGTLLFGYALLVLTNMACSFSKWPDKGEANRE